MCIQFCMHYICDPGHGAVFYIQCEKYQDIDDQCEDYADLSSEARYACKNCLTDWDNYPDFARVTELTEVDFESRTDELLGTWIFLQSGLENGRQCFKEEYKHLINPLDIQWLQFSRQCVENSLRTLMGSHPWLRPGGDGTNMFSEDVRVMEEVDKAIINETVEILAFLQASIEWIVSSNAMLSHAKEQARAARARLPFFVPEEPPRPLLPATICPICRVPYGTSQPPLAPGGEVIPPEDPVAIPNPPGCGHICGRQCLQNWFVQAETRTCPRCFIVLRERFRMPPEDDPNEPELFEPTPEWIQVLQGQN